MHRHAMAADMHMTGLTAAAQVACLLVGSFGAPVVAARLCTAQQWLSVLRLVRLPRAFSIVKASLLPHSPCSHACGPASGQGRLAQISFTRHFQRLGTEESASIFANILQVADVRLIQALCQSVVLPMPGMHAWQLLMCILTKHCAGV